MRSALADLTLAEEALGALGPALNSGRSFFLYGPPGNGKTAVAARLGTMFGEPIYIPHAVEVDGEIITVYDAAHHRRVASVVRGRRPGVGSRSTIATSSSSGPS